MILFIAEKPDLAKAICNALEGTKKWGKSYHIVGNNYVTWCYGHMLDLSDPEDIDVKYKKWKIEDLPVFWELFYKPKENSKDQLKEILNLIENKNVKLIVHAGDVDDEGQLLIDEIIAYSKTKKPVKRVLINDNTTPLVKKALLSLKNNADFDLLSKSALARQIADKFYGYNMTRAYTLSNQKNKESEIDGVIRVGRVQSVILSLVAKREIATKNHSSSNYYQIEATANINGKEYNFKHSPKEYINVDDKGRCNSEKEVLNIVQKIKSNAHCKIIEISTEEKKSHPPLTYNLIYLQADAANEFNMSSDKTLSVTQALRDKHKLITYNRSDCQYLSDEHHSEAANVISTIVSNIPDLNNIAMASDVSIKSKAFNSKNVTAHHAIIPTQSKVSIDKLTSNEKKIYLMICKRYLMQFLPNKKYISLKMSVEINGEIFSHNSNYTTNEGWEGIVKSTNENINSNDYKFIFDLDKNSHIDLVDVVNKKLKTSPPKSYTNASLLLELTRVAPHIEDLELRAVLTERDKHKKGENGGIGTPATRSNMIKSLFDQKLIKNQSKKVTVTDKGLAVYNTLLDTSKKPDLTAIWQKEMNEIQEGTLSIEKFIKNICVYIHNEIEIIKSR